MVTIPKSELFELHDDAGQKVGPDYPKINETIYNHLKQIEMSWKRTQNSFSLADMSKIVEITDCLHNDLKDLAA